MISSLVRVNGCFARAAFAALSISLRLIVASSPRLPADVSCMAKPRVAEIGAIELLDATECAKITQRC